MVICEGMGLLERIVQRSKQKKEIDLKAAFQAGVGETDASKGTGTGIGPGSDEGVSAEPCDQLDFLFIDADSKDSSLGLSAPPKSFITASALRTLFDGTQPLSLSYSLNPPLYFLISVYSPFSLSVLFSPSLLSLHFSSPMISHILITPY